MKRMICAVMMLSLLLCLFVSTMDASAIVNEPEQNNEQNQLPSPNDKPLVTESGDDDGGNGGNNNTNRRTAPKADSSSDEQILESYIGEYKNNPEKIRKDYKGLEKMEDLAIAEHTIHSGSSKQITISSKSLDADTPIAVYIVYTKDGKLVRESVNFERDGSKVIVNVPQHILDLHLDHIAVDIISFTLA